jgi:hypothetical protein
METWMQSLKQAAVRSSGREMRSTLVLPSAISPINWTAPNGQNDSRIIEVHDLGLLMAAFHNGVSELGQEIIRVILDRAVDARAFLQVVCDLPVGFRGDVLFIDWSGGGFLSAIGRGDDRVLYSLSAADVDFYRSVHGIGEAKEEPTQFSENILRFSTEPARVTGNGFDFVAAAQALSANLQQTR